MEREADYAAQREREWEQALAQEAEHHRSLPVFHDAIGLPQSVK